MINFNPLAARLLSAALRQKDLETAMQFALDLTDSDLLIQTRLEPGKEYTPVELADLIDSTLPLIERGDVNMSYGLYIPTVLGAVCFWILAETSKVAGEDTSELTGEDDGKTDSEPS